MVRSSQALTLHGFHTYHTCRKIQSQFEYVAIYMIKTHGSVSCGPRIRRAIPVIKTHSSVSCGPRSRRATPVSILTGRTKTSFSHHCISVITYLIGTKFATQLPASQGSLHSKFEGNRSSHFRDTSCQSFVFFFFFVIVIVIVIFKQGVHSVKLIFSGALNKHTIDTYNN